MKIGRTLLAGFAILGLMIQTANAQRPGGGGQCQRSNSSTNSYTNTPQYASTAYSPQSYMQNAYQQQLALMQRAYMQQAYMQQQLALMQTQAEINKANVQAMLEAKRDQDAKAKELAAERKKEAEEKKARRVSKLTSTR